MLLNVLPSFTFRSVSDSPGLGFVPSVALVLPIQVSWTARWASAAVAACVVESCGAAVLSGAVFLVLQLSESF